MKKLILIGVLVLLLAGGGVGAYLFLVAGDPAEAEAAATAEDGEDAGAAHAHQPGDRGGVELEFVRLRPILLQLPGPRGTRRNVSLTISLELAKPSYRAAVVALQPKLRARIFEAWASIPLVRNEDELYDIEEVKRRAKRASNATLGAGVVADVLVDDAREILVR